MSAPNTPVTPTAATGIHASAGETEDQFYEILAGAAKPALLASAVDTGLHTLLATAGPLDEATIAERLGLDPLRTRKWIGLLVAVPLIARVDGEGPSARYVNGSLLASIANPDGPQGYFYREFLRYWRLATWYDMTALLRGAKIDNPVRYPPVEWDDTKLLHDWMRSGAIITLQTILQHFDYGWVRRLLDVAGGDATMACELVRKYPHLHVTVFNVPQAVHLGQNNVRSLGLEGRVSFVEGDFRQDPLPTGFEVVMFSRVMADWAPEVCRVLMEKAHASLDAGGLLLIAEPFRDGNPDLSVAWEHSYMPYDDFGPNTYKYAATYQKMMLETGFDLVSYFPRQKGGSIHGVLIGKKRG